MVHKTILTTAIILLTCATLWTCKKEKIFCADDDAFCLLVNEQNFDETGPLIDDFLETLKIHDQAKNLEKLKDWLECKSCVTKAKILCNSCIKTLPAQSELSVKFIAGGQSVKKTLDILMDDPLKFRAYH